jgi:ABC-type Fe3+-hydroxamate transport system substrate-binding protein
MHLLLDQMQRRVAVPQFPQRIVSLVPSQTELLHHLQLGERVVGITKFCTRPSEWSRTKASVGGTKRVDLNAVRALRPDLVIGNKEENTREDIAALSADHPVWMSDVTDLPSALAMVEGVGKATGTSERSNELINDLHERFALLLPPTRVCTVAYFIWRKPWMVAAGNTFINDMIERAGWRNVFSDRKERYAMVNAGEITAARPQALLLSSEPFPFGEKHVQELHSLCPTAQVHLVDGECFSWYGSRMLHAPAYFQRLQQVVHGGGALH